MRFYSRGGGTHACQGNLCHLSLALLALQIPDQGTLTSQRTHLLCAVRGSGVEHMPFFQPRPNIRSRPCWARGRREVCQKLF